MRNKWLLALVVPAVLLWGGTAMAEMKGDAHLLLGQKALDEDDWEPVDSHTQYGVGANFGKVDWPVLIHVDIRMSSDDATEDYSYYGYTYGYEFDVDTTEFNVGVMKRFRDGEKAQPYVGGGASWIKGEATIRVFSDYFPAKQSFEYRASADDSAIGFWAGGGVMFMLGEKFNLGLDLRYSTADIEIDVEEFLLSKQAGTIDLDAGGMAYGVTFGFRF